VLSYAPPDSVGPVVRREAIHSAELAAQVVRVTPRQTVPEARAPRLGSTHVTCEDGRPACSSSWPGLDERNGNGRRRPWECPAAGPPAQVQLRSASFSVSGCRSAPRPAGVAPRTGRPPPRPQDGSPTCGLALAEFSTHWGHGLAWKAGDPPVLAECGLPPSMSVSGGRSEQFPSEAPVETRSHR
jgi:hypothetical protein